MTHRSLSRSRWRTSMPCVALALVLAAAGCGGDDDGGSQAGGPVEVTLSTWGTVSVAEEDFKTATELDSSLAEKMNLKVLLAGSNDTEAAATLRRQLSSGQAPPDIVQLNYAEIPEFGEAGVLSDIEPLAGDAIDNAAPETQELMQYKGQYVAYPLEVQTRLWFYRKDLFEQAGLDVASVRSTADLIAAGKALQAKFPEAAIWNIGAAPQQYDLVYTMFGNGAKILDKQEPGCAFVVATDPGVRQAFADFKQLQDSGTVANVSDFEPDWGKGLADGRIASSLIGSWFSTFLPGYAPDLAGKWGVAPWPAFGGGTGTSAGSGAVFVIPKDAEHKEEAADYLNRLYLSKEGSLALWKERALLPVVTAAQQDPAYTEGEEYFGPDLPNGYAESLKGFQVWDQYDPATIREATVLNNALIKYLSGGVELDAVLREAESNLQQQIGCPYK